MSGSRVYLRVNRTDPDVCAAAAAITMTDLYEAMGLAGRSAVMSPRMRPLLAGARMAGPAVTAWCGPGDNLMMHRALTLAVSGDVLVVVCGVEMSAAQWGDLATRIAQRQKLAGVVVQGCVRDVDTVRELGFAVWATAVHPAHPEKRGPGYVNMPVVCDGVTVNPGDIIVADGDGVLAVPRASASAVVAAASEKMRKEDRIIAAVAGGASLWDAANISAHYAAAQVEELDRAFDDA